jgi:hypothetical protein
MEIRNSIFWNNGGAGLCTDSGSLAGVSADKVHHCDFSDHLYEGKNGNFCADPLFVQPSAGDLHLNEDSPCIDAGQLPADPAKELDIDGDPRVVDGDGDGSALPDVGADEFVPVGVVLFFRGDANTDDAVNISDAVAILGFLFLGSPETLPCRKSADTDDTGTLVLTDAVYLLNFLFLGGPQPPSPFSDCDVDPTPDDLDCESFPPCG